MDDPTIKSGAQEKKSANKDHFLAQRQRELLLNDSANFTSQSEFYIFRYLAAEGFLPGYNFTRLPVRTFIGNRDRGEFISRPRFVALKEFGPNNIIYHMGNKYMVNRMMLSDMFPVCMFQRMFRKSGLPSFKRIVPTRRKKHKSQNRIKSMI